jgi:pimeloyl-ACP methyl ester carboxylesterase
MPDLIEVRNYGSSGQTVILLHGGPGAPGSLAPVARELSSDFRVLEPLQRASGGEPLTVARHVEDLQEVIEEYCPNERPALVGHSWGANLALCYAAEHPDSASAIVLVCSGTWDRNARARMNEIMAERWTPELQAKLDAISAEVTDPNEGLARRAKIKTSLYEYDVLDMPDETIAVDAPSNKETWGDLVRRQEEGVYPAAFSVIKSPVLMLHGAHDPHPGPLIRNSLLPHIPHLQYVELERCGHDPWRERHGREEFFRVLREWLHRNAE